MPTRLHTEKEINKQFSNTVKDRLKKFGYSINSLSRDSGIKKSRLYAILDDLESPTLYEALLITYGAKTHVFDILPCLIHVYEKGETKDG